MTNNVFLKMTLRNYLHRQEGAYIIIISRWSESSGPHLKHFWQSYNCEIFN